MFYKIHLFFDFTSKNQKKSKKFTSFYVFTLAKLQKTLMLFEKYLKPATSGIKNMSNYIIRRLKNDEQQMILPLLGACFPDYWEQIAVKSGKMPFEEISFAAFDGDKVIANCGIIP